MLDKNEKAYWLKTFEQNVEKAIDKDKVADILMVKRVSIAMELKLAEKRLEARGGWHDPEICVIEYLKKLLIEHIDKGDWVDVLNFAGMIYVREEMEVYTPHTIGGR